MNTVTIRALAHFSDPNVGAMARRQVRHGVHPEVAAHLQSLELVEIVGDEASPTNPAPTNSQTGTKQPDAGEEKSSPSSQAGQASDSQTANSSAKPDGGQSSSTTPGDSQAGQTSSTRPTTPGGKSTTMRSRETSKANAGQKASSRKGAAK